MVGRSGRKPALKIIKSNFFKYLHRKKEKAKEKRFRINGQKERLKEGQKDRKKEEQNDK